MNMFYTLHAHASSVIHNYKLHGIRTDTLQGEYSTYNIIEYTYIYYIRFEFYNKLLIIIIILLLSNSESTE